MNLQMICNLVHRSERDLHLSNAAIQASVLLECVYLSDRDLRYPPVALFGV
jgi:hypothetical protein